MIPEARRIAEIYAAAGLRVEVEPFDAGLYVYASTRVDADAVASSVRAAAAERDPASAVLGPYRAGPLGPRAWRAEVRLDWRRF